MSNIKGAKMQAGVEAIRTQDPYRAEKAPPVETLHVQVDKDLYDRALTARSRAGFTWRKIVELGVEHFITMSSFSDKDRREVQETIDRISARRLRKGG